MIVNWRHKGLEQFYKTGSTKGVMPAHRDKLTRILQMLDAATEPRGMDLPGFRLHPLKGGALAKHWSVSVNGNWRVTFRFTGANVELVDYQDYH